MSSPPFVTAVVVRSPRYVSCLLFPSSSVVVFLVVVVFVHPLPLFVVFIDVLVDCTSSDPTLAGEIAAAAAGRGCWAVDAQVSGGDVGARDGKLAIFAGGDEGVVGWLSPLFDALGRATWMGPAGSGQSSKIANQITIGGSLLGLSEAIVFAERAGLDVAAFLDAVGGGAAGSKSMEIFGGRMVGRDFAPGGFAKYMVKDLGMGLGDGGVVLKGKRVLEVVCLITDKDSTGTIKYGELNRCLNDLNFSLTEKDTRHLYHYCDMDGHKGIQFNEFIVLLCLANLLMELTSASNNIPLPGSPQLEATINRLVEAFIVLDKDGDGKLRRRDMTAALHEASRKDRSPSHITSRRFKEMDWNRDGKVNFKEFLLYMTKWIVIDVDEEMKSLQ